MFCNATAGVCHPCCGPMNRGASSVANLGDVVTVVAIGALILFGAQYGVNLSSFQAKALGACAAFTVFIFAHVGMTHSTRSSDKPHSVTNWNMDPTTFPLPKGLR